MLLASSLFLIVNTIRLATFARRREIEVMKLVGASNWFVRIPFIAEGMVQGLVGAGLAIIAVLSLKHFGFDQAFNDPKSFFGEFFVTTGDATWIAFLVLLIGVGIGIVGASIGLRQIPQDLRDPDEGFGARRHGLWRRSGAPLRIPLAAGAERIRPLKWALLLM